MSFDFLIAKQALVSVSLSLAHFGFESFFLSLSLCLSEDQASLGCCTRFIINTQRLLFPSISYEDDLT